MGSLGKGPYRSSDVANTLGEDLRALGPRRAKIIHKGMIYSAAHGDIDFTVPMFDDFLRRHKGSLGEYGQNGFSPVDHVKSDRLLLESS